MPCSNCKEVEDLTIPEIALQYTTDEKRVLGRDGELYLVTRSLVPAGQRPRRGWGVVIDLNGQTIDVKGQSAEFVATAVKKLLELNSFRISNLNLWFNLNVQWLSRTNEKYQVVKLETLLSQASR